jgi:hypothetical protein
MFSEGGQTRKHCFLAMFPEGGQTRKQNYLGKKYTYGLAGNKFFPSRFCFRKTRGLLATCATIKYSTMAAKIEKTNCSLSPFINKYILTTAHNFKTSYRGNVGLSFSL